jgi:hypothetical protein
LDADRLRGSFVPLGEQPRFLTDLVVVAPAIAPPPFALVLECLIPMCQHIVNLEDHSNTPGVYFGIRGPGELEVVTYQSRRRRSWILSRGVCQEIQDLEKSRLFRELCKQAVKSIDCGVDLAAEILQHLTYEISRRGHGGALIFADNPHASTTPEIDFRGDPFPLLRADRPSKDLLQTATVLSSLTQIDGAVILDSRLRVKGAGVFLDQMQAVPGEVEDKAEEEIKKSNLGSRHRSAVWFCRNNPGARAIVISKDRIIRIFEHGESGVDFNGPYLDSMIPVGRPERFRSERR